jgi:hypothetical protein
VLPRLIPTGFDLLDGKPEKNIEEEIKNRIKDRMYELRSKI